jgi:hypothetical protein
VSKNKDGVLVLLNVRDSIKRLLLSEKFDALIYSSPVSVKMEHNKAFFSLTGCVDDLAVLSLRKPLEQILENNKVKEIYFYLGSLNTVSKQVIITFVELWCKLVKTGITVKLTPVNPDAEGAV